VTRTIESDIVNQVWWFMPVIPVLQNIVEFGASLGYRTRFTPS
jgi:hypothetical protein